MLHEPPHITTSRIALGACVMLISGLFFSYHPVLQLGTVSGFYIDLALLYLIAAVAVFVNAAVIYHHRSELWRARAWRFLLIFTTYLTLSCLWSTNTLRALATAAFMWLIVGIVSMLLVHTPNLVRQSKHITALLGIGLTLSVIWAVWQIIGDALGVEPAFTLLPLAYSSDVFGIARPTAFALEPQFLASLLLAPLSWFLFQTLQRPSLINAASLVMTTMLLVLTLSRGGIVAAGLVVAIILLTTPASLRQRLPAVSALSIAALLSFAAIAGVASLNQRDSISGYSALRGSISHLSLGTIMLPPESTATPQDLPAPTPTEPSATAEPEYVRDSTTSRLSMGDQATALWLSTPQTILFGVGIGGFGASAHANNPKLPVSSIVNNNYLEILAETGLVGFALLIAFFGSVITALWRARRYAFIGLLTAFLLQWCFFSGNANVLHIWVFTGFAMGILQSTRKPQAA